MSRMQYLQIDAIRIFEEREPIAPVVHGLEGTVYLRVDQALALHVDIAYSETQIRDARSVATDEIFIRGPEPGRPEQLHREHVARWVPDFSRPTEENEPLVTPVVDDGQPDALCIKAQLRIDIPSRNARVAEPVVDCRFVTGLAVIDRQYVIR